MSKELEALDIQENFINCFKELLTKTNPNILQINLTRNMAQEIVNLYEQYKNSNPSEALNKLLDRANHDEFLGRIETDKAINFLNENQAFANTIKQALIKAQEQALQRLEAIDNANPSEALELVNTFLKYYGENDFIEAEISKEDVLKIKQALLKAQEQEKENDRLDTKCLNILADNIRLENILKVIKKKRVDMETLENAIFREKAKQVKSGLQWYNNQVKFHSNKQLTEEEFDTLKRYLGNE